MNTLEDRVRAALHARAEDFSADPDAWARVRARSLAGRRRRSVLRWRPSGRFLIPTAAAAAVVAVVVGVTVAVNGITGQSAAVRPAGARSARPSPAERSPEPAASPTGGPNGPFFIDDYPPVSTLLTFRLTAPGTGRTALAYAWLGYINPLDWMDQPPGLQSCTYVNYPGHGGSGFCAPLPRLGPGEPARVTASNYLGASAGPLVLQGVAVNQVASVTAVLPDGQDIPGLVKTWRGSPDKAWAVVAPADEATFKPVSGIRLVFRDASGAEVAALGTAAPTGPLQVAEPRSGGIAAFRTPCCGSVYAYLIDGYVGFFLARPLATPEWGSWTAPQLAAGSPALSGLSEPFGGVLSGGTPGHGSTVIEAFGYAHANVARVVLRTGSGRQVSTSTFAAWPGSDLRLWAVALRQGTESQGEQTKLGAIAATGYDAAGQAVAHVKLGQSGG